MERSHSTHKSLNGIPAAPVPRLPGECVPLAFSQQWPWLFLDPDKLVGTRSVALAIHLSGPLNVQGLRSSFTELVLSHESLRTRIVRVAGRLEQKIDAAPKSELEVVALENHSQLEREMLVTRLAHALAHEPVETAVGPLFAARLLKLSDLDHVLVIAMDHVISDYVSLCIAHRDLWTLYGQALRGIRLALPKVPVQFADYAVWEQETQDAWSAEHGAYWSEHLTDAPVLRPFKAEGPPVSQGTVMQTLPVRLGGLLSAGLRELSRRARTVLPMTVLSVYVALLARWCAVSDVVVALVSMGRFHPAVKNSIGFFAASLFLRVQLRERGSFLDLVRRVTQEYYAAYGHADCGRVAAQQPTPEFVSNPRFNWIPTEFNIAPAGFDAQAASSEGGSIRQSSSVVLPRPDFDARGGACELTLSDAKAGIEGVIWYRADLFAAHAVERFVRDFQVLVEKVVADPEACMTAAWLALDPGG